MERGASSGAARLLRLGLFLAGVGYSFTLILLFAQHFSQFQWDFRTYYFAASADAQGLDPYDTALLSRLAGERVELQYVYPPLTLYAFRPLLALEYGTARGLFLVLKCLGALALFLLWKRLLGKAWDLLFLPFSFLAFNFTLFLDFRSGNVGLFEELLLWIGISQLLQRRYGAFVFLLAAAAAFKITPLLFLGLLLCSGDSRPWRRLAWGVGLYGTAQLLPLLSDPHRLPGMLANWSQRDEGGRLNPATYSALVDLSRWLGLKSGYLADRLWVFALYALLAVGVAVLTWKALGCLRQAGAPLLQSVFLFSLAYALVLPRFKDYSYVLLLPAAFALLRGKGGPWDHVRLLFFTLFSTPDFAWRWSSVLPWWWLYLPILAVGLLWAVSVRRALALPEGERTAFEV